jgi:hypothetical protein
VVGGQGWTLQDRTVDVESGGVARALPCLLGVVEPDDAAQVGAGRRDLMDNALGIAVGGASLTVHGDDCALTGCEVRNGQIGPLSRAPMRRLTTEAALPTTDTVLIYPSSGLAT